MRPLLPGAQALAARGHDVLVVSDDRIADNPELGSLRFQTLPDRQTLMPDIDFDGRHRNLEAMTREQRVANGFDFFVRQSEAMTPYVVEVIEAFRPDVIFREIAFFAGLFAGLRTDVPVAAFSFASRSSSTPAPAISDRLRTALKTLRIDADVDSLDRWLTVFGLPPCWFDEEALPPTAHLVQPAEPHVVDNGTARRLLEGLPDRPTVYATLGTTFADTPGLLELVLDGLASLDINVIATTGNALDAAALHPPRSNVRLAAFVPQSLLLPHCDAVVAHGGYGSLMGALRLGLPIVSVPIAASDNITNATRLESLGACRAVHENARSAQAVADATWAVLTEPSYRVAAQAVADEIATLPPPEHTADLLEQLARTRRPVLRELTNDPT